MTRVRNRATRGQLVLAMSVVVAVALVPIATAYLQLGYASVSPALDRENTADDVARAVAQAVAGVEQEVAGEYAWADNERAIGDVRSWLTPRLDGIESPGRADAVVVTVTYNQSLAREIATSECPRGPGREFGDCVAERGVVVQDRAGETVLVAVALDVRVVRPGGGTWFTRAYRP